MTGVKYVLKNNTTSVQFFDYKTLSDSMWTYQVSLKPGQVKTIWAETGTLKIYNNGSITIEEESTFPPTNNTIGRNIETKTIDYLVKVLKSTSLGDLIKERKLKSTENKVKNIEKKREEKRKRNNFSNNHIDDNWTY
jgi:hypothetical protein